MHLPVTRYGMPQVLIYPVITLIAMAALFIFLPGGILLVAAEIILFLIFVWMLSFFRNPVRKIPMNNRVILSPADGAITDIYETEIPEINGKVLCIGIFLSVFNVHVNRVPCSVRIEEVNYKKGLFKNALSSESARINESNSVLMTRLDAPCDRLLVRQISGAIARHIVCEAKPGQEYAQGTDFGMIKFGSRTELYLPLGSYTIAAKIGDKVKAGLTPLIEYK